MTARLRPTSGGLSLVISTDPPYYDNIGYADLADFFYVWLRRSLRGLYPDLLDTVLTPKAAELVATPYRFGGSKEKAERHFHDGFLRAFTEIRRKQLISYPLTVFYAFKQAETKGGNEELAASTGWETMLAGLLDAGLAVTGTWPMRTELGNRMLSQGTNALASSIAIVCRPKPATATVTGRRGFLRALKAELPGALRNLQQGSVAPVDLAQATIGPGMAIFSRFSTVVEPTGEPMTVRTALGLIHQVRDEVQSEHDGEFDADTRWAIRWFERARFGEGTYGQAEGFAIATNTAIRALEERGILRAFRGRVRLLERAELAKLGRDSDPRRTPVWQATQRLIHALETDGEQAAADLFVELNGQAEAVRDLAYRLYQICDRRGWAKDGTSFNALVTSWPEIVRLADQRYGSVRAEQGTLS